MSSFQEQRREELEKQRKEDPYGYSLSQLDKLRADTNKDGIVSKDEYETFLLSEHEEKQEIIPKTTEVHTYYHFDITVLVAIVLVCITAVIISFIRIKKAPAERQEQPD